MPNAKAATMRLGPLVAGLIVSIRIKAISGGNDCRASMIRCVTVSSHLPK